jgi:hypothetical protein
MTEDQSLQDFDPENIRAASRKTHRMVGIITGMGVFLYLAITAFNAYLNVVGLPAMRGRLVMTIPTDTALGVLGVTATVLVAFIASWWTSANLPATAQSAYGRGRRLVLVDVTLATGGGSVFVGLAGALHGWGEHVNVVVSLAILGLSVALAYVAAEIGEFMKRDHDVQQSVQSMAYRTKMSRLRNARRYWLRRSRAAGRSRISRGLLARVRQNLGCVVAATLLQSGALLAFHGRRDLTVYLVITVGCVVWSLIVGQLMAHYGAVTFIQRNLSTLLLVCVISLLALAVDASIAHGLAVTFERSAVMPAIAAHAFAWLTVYGPLLLCLAGLTVAPTTWRRYRPMTGVRWGVISALSRHIDKLARSESDQGPSARRGVISRRLGTAIRAATGVEPMPTSPAPMPPAAPGVS